MHGPAQNLKTILFKKKKIINNRPKTYNYIFYYYQYYCCFIIFIHLCYSIFYKYTFNCLHFDCYGYCSISVLYILLYLIFQMVQKTTRILAKRDVVIVAHLTQQQQQHVIETGTLNTLQRRETLRTLFTRTIDFCHKKEILSTNAVVVRQS